MISELTQDTDMYNKNCHF